MLLRLSLAVLICTVLVSARERKTSGTNHGENENIIVTATVYTAPADIKNLVGDDLGGHFIVASIKVEPKYGKEVTIDRDDFVLWTDKDGEHSQPYEGSQIAGSTALVVGQTKGDSPPGMSEPGNVYNPPVSVGGPVMYPQPGIGIGGGGKGDNTVSKGSIKHEASGDDAPTPLETTLNAKMLRDGKTGKPVSGLLYFPLEKQKLKDLQLIYGTAGERISLRFNNK